MNTPSIGSDGTVQLGRHPNRQTLRIGLDVEDDDGVMDLTGGKLQMDFRTSPEDPPSLTLTSESGGGITMVALSGQITCTVDTDSLGDMCGYFVWAIAFRDPSGDVPFVVCGDIDLYRPAVEVPNA